MPKRILCISLALFALTLSFSDARAQVNVTNAVVAANTALIWEAQTYVPPFYEGKALFPDGGSVKILAFPPVELGNPYNLSYTWRVDGEVDEAASGPGKSFFVYNSDIFGGSPLIVVDVMRDHQKVSTGVIRVPITKPRVLIYPSRPLSGVLFGMSPQSDQSDEVTLESYPLFFSTRSKSDPSLTYKWELNGLPAQNPLGNSGRLVVRGETGGTSVLKLTVYNNDNPLEYSDNSTALTFE